MNEPRRLEAFSVRVGKYETEFIARLGDVNRAMNEKYARQRAIRRVLREDLRAWDADELEREAMLYALDGNSDILTMYRGAEELTHTTIDEFIENIRGHFSATEPASFGASQKMLFDLLSAYWGRVSHVASKGMNLRLADQNRRVGDLLLQINQTRMVDLIRELARAQGEAAEVLAQRVAHEVMAAASAASPEQVERLATAVEGLQLAEEARRRIGPRIAHFMVSNAVAVGVNISSAVLAKVLGLPV